MKSFKCCVWTVLFVLSTGCGGGSTQSVSELVRVTPDELAFGDVAQGGSFSKEVELRNDGRSRLTVSADELPEGFSVEPRKAVIATGESISVRVIFSPGTKEPVSESIRFRSRNSDAEAVLLVGGAVAERAFEVEEVLRFGDVAVGRSTSLQLPVRSLVDVPLEIEVSLSGSGDYAAHHERFELDARETASLGITFSPRSRGPLLASVRLLPCAGCSEERVSLQGRGVELRLETTPDLLDFGRVPLGISRIEPVEVKNAGDVPIRLAAPAWEPSSKGVFWIERMEVPDPLEVGETGKIFLRFAPEAETPSEATLRLLDTDGLDLSEVRVQGLGGGPKLVVSPSSIDFGIQPLGRRVAKVVTIENTGNVEAVYVNSISVEGPDSDLVRVTSPSFPIEVGRQPVDLGISIVADREGDLHADVIFHTTLSGQPSVQLPIRAKALAPRGCDLQQDWNKLRFGLVNAPNRVTRAIELTNAGSEPCLVWDGEILGEHADVFILEEEWEPFLLAPGERFSVPVSFESEKAPTRKVLDATLLIHRGPLQAQPIEIPIVAMEINWLWVALAPTEATFEPTPVGRATVVTLEFMLSSPNFKHFVLSDDSSSAFRVPGGQRDSSLTGEVVVVNIAFMPQEEGVHRGILEFWQTDSPVPFIVDLMAIAEAPCESCDWPSPNCGDKTTFEVGEEHPLSDDPQYTCNWRIIDPPKPNDGRGYNALEFSLELDSSFSCTGRLVPRIVGPLVLSNLRVRPDGRAAYCEVPIQVIPPPGLWVEAIPPSGFLANLDVSVLRGDGGDPTERDSWFDEGSVCTGNFQRQEISCPWGEEGPADDPTFPQSGSYSVRFQIEEPSTQQPYHFGLYGRPSLWGDSVPVDLRVYCGQQLVSTTSVTTTHNDIIVAGAVQVTSPTDCTFVPDGVTSFPYFLPPE